MAKVTREAGNRGGSARAVLHKEGGDQVGGRDGRFRKQPPDSGGTAEAATSDGDGKLGTQGNWIISPPEMKMKIKIKGVRAPNVLRFCRDAGPASKRPQRPGALQNCPAQGIWFQFSIFLLFSADGRGEAF